MAKRLVKIAKELNVGTTTIVEHLNNNGFEIENKPTAKISDEMYVELLKEFQKSIAIKEKADYLVIGNRSGGVERLRGLKVMGKIELPPNMSEVSKRIRKAKEKEEKFLDLSRMNLKEIPDEVSEVNSLEKIDLSNNQIGELSDAFLKMPSIIELNASYNNLDYSSFIKLSNIPSIRLIDISGNQIEVIDEELRRFKNLKVLNLSKNRVKKVGVDFSVCPRLTDLNLSENLIEEIDIVNFINSKLVVLDLSGNPLKHLDEDIIKQKKLKSLFLTGCEIENIPIEIYNKQGDVLSAVKDYFYSTADKSETSKLFEAKLLVVGNGGVGKSSLVRKLLNRKSKFIENHDSTQGIDIKTWKLNVKNVVKSNFGSDFVTLNIWDFGGQEIYRSTHQFFLTKNSLYLFVWDARANENYLGFHYWLNTIKTFADSSPVIVVMNKSDSRQKEIDSLSLVEKYPNIVDFLKVSCKSLRGIDDLGEIIRENIVELRHIGDTWSQVRIKIKDIIEAREEDYISFKEYSSLCKKEGLNDEQLEHFTNQLHDLGVLMHFKKNPILKNIIILNPEWATDAVYKVFDDHDSVEKQGKLKIEDFERIWEDDEKHKSMSTQLIQLMTEFKMCFYSKFDEVYIVPHLLSANRPAYEPFDEDITFELKVIYDFLPAGLIEYFICDNNHLIEKNNYWKNGLMLKFNARCRAEIFISPVDSKNIVFIKIESKVKTEKLQSLAVINNSFEKLHKVYGNLIVQRKIRCNCSTNKRCFFDEDKIADYQDYGINAIRCNRREFKYRLIPLDFFNSKGLSSDIITQAENLVKEGELRKAMKVISEFIQKGGGILSKHYEDQLTILQSRFENLKEQIMIDVIDDNQAARKQNKIIRDFLSFLRDLESFEYE